MTCEDVLAALRPMKGEFRINSEGAIRHETIRDTDGLPACPWCVLATKAGYPGSNLRPYPMAVMVGVGISKGVVQEIVASADYPDGPYRSELEAACLETP